MIDVILASFGKNKNYVISPFIANVQTIIPKKKEQVLYILDSTTYHYL